MSPVVQKQLKFAHGPGLDETMGLELMKALGISTLQTFFISEPEADIPPNLPYPLAVKVVSPDLLHKTEAGAIALGVGDKKELRDAMISIWESARNYAPEARLSGVMVEPMIDALAEVLLGFRRDVEAGPIVVLGMGGILTEVYKDFAVRTAPVNKVAALEMIGEVKGLAPIRGYRNLPNGDCDALADAVVSLSALALAKEPRVAEAEINPVMVMREGKGVIAVDALMQFG